MKYKVVISKKNKTFPIRGLNELLAGRMYNYRTKKYHNYVKSDNDRVCCVAIRRDLKGVTLKTPIRCTYYIYAQDKRHDRNNLESATTKSFLDALQQCGCIKSDGFDYVLDSVFHSDVCQENPRIEVFIEEV
jgi:Holliday junction resolvase RusA-like endonuclease